MLVKIFKSSRDNSKNECLLIIDSIISAILCKHNIGVAYPTISVYLYDYKL